MFFFICCLFLFRTNALIFCASTSALSSSISSSFYLTTSSLSLRSIVFYDLASSSRFIDKIIITEFFIFLSQRYIWEAWILCSIVSTVLDLPSMAREIISNFNEEENAFTMQMILANNLFYKRRAHMKLECNSTISMTFFVI